MRSECIHARLQVLSSEKRFLRQGVSLGASCVFAAAVPWLKVREEGIEIDGKELQVR